MVFNACEKLSQHYKIKQDKCTKFCMECVAVCGYGAIQLIQSALHPMISNMKLRYGLIRQSVLAVANARCIRGQKLAVEDDDYEDGHSVQHG